MTRFIFVRHGQTEWNRVLRFRGRADVPLNDTGVEQARRAAERLAATPLAAIYASPLSRTVVTAKLIALPHRLEVVPQEALLDLDYGAWQGQSPEEVAQQDPEQFALWRTRPDQARIPNGETLSHLRSRLLDFTDLLGEQHAGETVALVSHDIVGKMLICAVLGLGNDAVWRIAQDTAALDVIEKSEEGFVIRAMNDTAHLDGSGR